QAGKCGVALVKQGLLAGTQTAGDCKKKVCDGKGALTTVVDATDKPDDRDPCTQDGCTNGVPSHPFASPNTPCGPTSGLKCDEPGHCVGCSMDTDCGTDEACTSFKCTSGKCAFSYVQNGQGDPPQTAGDCKKAACNGSGSTKEIVDDSDLPKANR